MSLADVRIEPRTRRGPRTVREVKVGVLAQKGRRGVRRGRGARHGIGSGGRRLVRTALVVGHGEAFILASTADARARSIRPVTRRSKVRASPLPIPHSGAIPEATAAQGRANHIGAVARGSADVRRPRLAPLQTSMGYPLALALRYLGSKKRAMVSVGTAFAILGVTLGVAALAIVMSVTGGFKEQFREKVLGVNAHVLVLGYSLDFREYRDVMHKVRTVKGVTGVAPFVINPMMVTRGDRTATGVLLKGVDPTVMGQVLDLPRYVVAGTLEGMRRPGATPPARPIDTFRDPLDDFLRDGGASGNVGGARTLLDEIQHEIQEDDARAKAGADESPSDETATPHARPAPTRSEARSGPVLPARAPTPLTLPRSRPPPPKATSPPT